MRDNFVSIQFGSDHIGQLTDFVALFVHEFLNPP